MHVSVHNILMYDTTHDVYDMYTCEQAYTSIRKYSYGLVSLILLIEIHITGLW